MPGLYNDNDYDLAGFCVGIVNKDKLIDGHKIHKEDTIIALSSSGVHSNGFSLVRSILANHPNNDKIPELLKPTKIYVLAVLDLLNKVSVKGIANITGGGLIENIPRILPKNLSAVLNRDCWSIPDIFKWLQKSGNITDNEMYRVFNCGIGMVLIVSKKDVQDTLAILQKNGEDAFVVGSITKNHNNKQIIIKCT